MLAKYYVAALTDNKEVVKAEGGSLLLALERFRWAWNEHAGRGGTMFAIQADIRFTPDEFFKRFHVTDRAIITTSKLCLEAFVDCAADETIVDENEPKVEPSASGVCQWRPPGVR